MPDPSSFRDQLLRRPLDRRAFLRSMLAASAGGAAIYAVGCGSGDDDPAPSATAAASPGAMRSPTPGASGALTPVLLTSEFVANQDNRFAVGLLDGDQKLVKDADVHLRFFAIGEDGVTGTLRGEGDMTYVELNVEGSDDLVSFYTANTPFDAAGKWGVQVEATPTAGGETASAEVPFEVLAASKSPAIGTVPPASVHDTAATNTVPGSICSSDPVCSLHDLVIADVLGKGRPLVVQFSTPAFCETRFCGPVLDVLLEQVPEYRDRIDFVHIEVWQDFQLQIQRPAVAEWNLPSEPYTFFMASDGRVVSKLESIFSDEELGVALEQLVQLT